LSNPDSFIDEVTEEVRRDRLFAMFRKYGWIGVVGVIAIVGGTAFSEWQKAQAAARAQGFGDAVAAAMALPTPAERADALAAVKADAGQIAPKALLMASEADTPKALQDLRALAGDASQPQIYRDLASLRAVMLAGKDQPLVERRAVLEGLAVPGRAFRTLALEQIAYLLVEEGKTEDAIKALGDLMQDQAATDGLRARASQMITALGGTPPEARDATAG
jgi:hypothetical protein